MYLFVSDVSRDIGGFVGAGGRVPRIGDRLTAVNGVPAGAHLARLGQFVGKSTHAAHWWDLAYRVSLRSRHIAPELFAGDRITYELETPELVRYAITLPYLQYEAIEWAGHDDHYTAGELADLIRGDPDFMKKSHQLLLSLRRYRGFEHAFSRPSFDLFVSPSEQIVLLQAHSFSPRSIAGDLDYLMAHAREHGLLGHAVIFDLTRGSGGDFEEYALQRLQPRPFKTMSGNLRISGITADLAAELRGRVSSALTSTRAAALPELLAREVFLPDAGRHLLDWLDRDVAAAIRAGQAYTNDVPFKGQFLPVTSDGYLYPAKEHFAGPMVLFTAPSACSGADQFAAMFIDNELGGSFGMPEGGCSNTWEWDEVLKLPSSGKPVAGFSWTVGHSIRPNGQVLEGNPAVPGMVVPLTRTNHPRYYHELLEHARRDIRDRRQRGRPTRLDRLIGSPSGNLDPARRP